MAEKKTTRVTEGKVYKGGRNDPPSSSRPSKPKAQGPSSPKVQKPTKSGKSE